LLELSKRYPPSEPLTGRVRSERKESRKKRAREKPEPVRSVSVRDESVDGEGFSLPPVVRVPTGYIFVISAFVLAVVLGGYFIGFSRGSSSERAWRAEEVARDIDEQGVRDPLLRTAPLNPRLLQATRADGGNVAATSEVVPRGAGPSLANAILPIAPEQDPRVPGKNYYIIARDLPGEAVRAATYLRQQGIRASALSTGRADRKLVVAMEPFASDMATSQVAREYKARIQEAGRLWKRDHRGTTDFSDCYLARYSN
jgi:hypothetical protein